jgi:hypothetical protein
MRQGDLLDVLRQRPFRAFRIRLTDGTMFDIRHPEMTVVGRSTALVFYPPAGMSLPAIDRYETIAVLHMTGSEPEESSAA